MENKDQDYLYCINIGSVYCLNENKTIQTRSFGITESQRELLLMFADVRKDKDLNSIYRINDCEFTITPFIKGPGQAS